MPTWSCTPWPSTWPLPARWRSGPWRSSPWPGAGALLRAKHSRALLWAQRNPWRFAAFPGAACAIVVFALSMVVDGGLFGSLFTALWHGAATYGLTGLVGSVGRPRRARS